MGDDSEIYFPHDDFRKIQSEMIEDVASAIRAKKNLIVHAPTGLGKTAASIAPALTYAIKNKKTVFFLTSRHTQHKIAIETLKNIKKKYNLDFSVVDIIGKKWMCLQPGVEALYSSEFSEYCKAVREDGKCEFYVNTKNKSNKLTVNAQLALDETKNLDLKQMMGYCKDKTLCPYEISVALGRDAKVVVCDYFYIFNPDIRDMFLTKTSKELDDIILIIDEAHNLPFRVRDLMTERLSNIMVKRAIKEASKFGYEEMVEHLQILNNVLEELAQPLTTQKKFFDEDKKDSTLTSFTSSNDKKKTKFDTKSKEQLVRRDQFLHAIKRHIEDYEQLIADLQFLADEIREKQKVSYLGSVASFLEIWTGQDEGFARILSVKDGDKGPIIILSYRCLDPSLICRDVVNGVHSSIVMSGTLVPVEMYRDLLGLENAEQKSF
jgi:DNA excision repair protein ERCC-2